MANELLTPGKGTFLIKKAKLYDDYNQHLTTKNGDRKVLLVVDVTDSKGAKDVVFEHLTLKAAWKVEIICKACRHHELFISDALCLDKLDYLEGAVGECIIGHSEPSAQWPEKTIIAKWIVPKAAKTEKPIPDSAVKDFFEDEEIPF